MKKELKKKYKNTTEYEIKEKSDMIMLKILSNAIMPILNKWFASNKNDKK